VIRFGDTIEALPGSVEAIFSEGRSGKVASTQRGGDPYSKNLVRWKGSSILLGFREEEVRKINDTT